MTTQNVPLVYNLTLGVTSVQILPTNPSRKALLFFNPSSNTVSVCPALGINGQQVPAVVNGAGSITIFSGGLLSIPQGGWPENMGLGAAFNAIASGANTPFSIWEF